MRFLMASVAAILFGAFHLAHAADDWRTPFEKSDGWDTADYLTGLRFYEDLASTFDRVDIRAAGPTDSGFPLHVVTVSADANFDLDAARRSGKSILLINNAIHPGESDGVDASMMLVRDLARGEMPDNVIVAVIPFYNIGGALNRNSGSRVNQNGPREYGFRGNSQNFDLNRDFIKCDTLNAFSFARIFQELDPDLLIDTHVSNGSDYQYVMTTAHSQKDKLGYSLGRHLSQSFQPQLFDAMDLAGFATVPYVNSDGSPPELGFAQFLETPRYSTGYAALFQTMGFMTETHMLKPYPQRVAATRAFMDAAIDLLAQTGPDIRAARVRDRQDYSQQTTVPITWKLNRQKPSALTFRGYEARRIDSRVTPGQRLFYDREKPFTRTIKFYDHYEPGTTVTLPAGYLIPQGWHRVIDRMKANGVAMTRVAADGTIEAQQYRITKTSHAAAPFEGHYFHDAVEVDLQVAEVDVRAGDYVIAIGQSKARYVVETLEPEATDSFFRWNFFDTILQRKEHFSPYVFEETAAEVLTDEGLREQFEARKLADVDFANDRFSQLQFLYENSPHHEADFRRYPVLRLINKALMTQD